MEVLKDLEAISEPDDRMNCMVLVDHASGEIRPLRLGDIYATAETIKLHMGVPEEIRSHFETARNLFVYSWFFYPFNVAAQLHAFLSVEFALKVRAGMQCGGFRRLLKRAVAEGWISDKGFSGVEDWRLRGMNRALNGEKAEASEVKTYSQVLIEVLPYLRNELAHGSTMLHNRGAEYVGICAEFINQLFDTPLDSTGSPEVTPLELSREAGSEF